MIFLGAAMAVLASLHGCSRESRRPDVVLVTIDTLRADHCSAYGYGIPTTPSLDALAARGTMFRRAYSESSTTAPSHAVLMTGRHFRTYGTTKNGAPLPEEVTTLAEAMQGAGYATAAFISSFPLLTRFGFAQGFEVYDDKFETEEASIGRRKEGHTPHDRLAAETLAHLKAWIEKRDDPRPLFLWVHFVDPHAPYHAPEKFQATWPKGTKRHVQRYDAEVHYADRRLGELLRLVAQHTPGHEDLVVVTSDHGEGLGDHDWMSHGINLHEEAVRVPLVVSWPGRVPEAKVVEEPVSIVDIAPGILDLLGIPAQTFAHGRSLFGPADASRPIFLQRRDYKTGKEKGKRIDGEMTAVVQGSSEPGSATGLGKLGKLGKLILAPQEKSRQLYDLVADPREANDLIKSDDLAAKGAIVSPAQERREAAHEPEARRLEQALELWKQAFPAAAATDAPVDEETLKALRALGYVD